MNLSRLAYALPFCLAMAVASPASAAAIPETGAQLRTLIEACGKVPKGVASDALYRSCYGFQIGIISGALIQDHLMHAAPSICVDASDRQVNQAILDFLDKTPDAAEWHASAVVIGAAMTSFPCKEEASDGE